MKRRGLLWFGVAVTVILTTRWLCYALAPSPLATRFEGAAGGPSLVVVTLVSLVLAGAVSAAAVWLAVVGVRERQRFRPERELPRLRLRRIAARTLMLSTVCSLGFALLESYIHWRAGLGFHGLSCLFGPVHRNALPLIVALSILAAGLAEAVQHLHAWARAAVRELLRPRVFLRARAHRHGTQALHLIPALVRVAARSRAPPLPA
jgi:hypothetical protein